MEALTGRIALLDRAPLEVELAAYGELGADINSFTRLLSTIVPVGVARVDGLPLVRPEVADSIVGTSTLFERVRSRWPEIVHGPIDKAHQQWISTGRPPHLPPRKSDLARQEFIEEVPSTAATKPQDLGLYTSTGTQQRPGMWWRFLDLNRGSSLFPEPWTVWELEVQSAARVLEIASASAWAEMVSSYPVSEDGLIYPDWRRIAVDWDGVHLTMQSIAAIQGLRLVLTDGVAAPTYWDVESTLWLRWMVETQSLIASTT